MHGFDLGVEFEVVELSAEISGNIWSVTVETLLRIMMFGPVVSSKTVTAC